MSARDDLMAVLAEARYPLPTSLSTGGLMADAILAAGYRPPARTIETPDDRNALAVGTVVRSAGGTIACRYDVTSGVVFGMSTPFKWSDLALPLTVLWDAEVVR